MKQFGKNTKYIWNIAHMSKLIIITYKMKNQGEIINAYKRIEYMRK